MESPQYAPPAEPTPDDLARALAGGDAQAINTETLGAAFTWPESQTDVLEAVCLSLTASPDTVLRYTGLLALGHLARRVGLTWPSAAWDAARRLRSDPELSGACEVLADDLETFGHPDPEPGV